MSAETKAAGFGATAAPTWKHLLSTKMKYKLFSFPLILVCCSASLRAQPWSGIIGAGRAIDWSAVGIAGGIPNRSVCATVNASTYGNGASDATSGIQSALNSCGASQAVSLSAGTFRINGTVNIPSNVTLRGAGPQNTILKSYGTAGTTIAMGTWGDAPWSPGSATIISGATAGSTSMVLSAQSTNGMNTSIGSGGYLLVTELNDPTYVTTATIQNSSCTYCDAIFGGTRVRGQIVEVTSVSGSGPYTVSFNPPLYSNYGTAAGTAPAWATPFGVLAQGAPDAKMAGIESLQIYSTGSGISGGLANITMTECVYCWVKNVESNYTDADHIDVQFGFRDEIRDSYFSNAYGHTSGGSDADVMLAGKTSSTLVENNIFERLHSSLVLNWGAAGNVMSYNYSMGAFDSGAVFVNMVDFAANHGAHPQFNLFEGNIGPDLQPDSVHGSSSHLTSFRNWWTGDSLIAPFVGGGYTGRAVVDWANAHHAYQQNRPITIAFPDSYSNLVGNALGSSAAITAVGGTTKLFNSGTAPCTSCILPPAQRAYAFTLYAMNFGYDTGSDLDGLSVAALAGGPSNAVGYWVGQAYNTAFVHGNYDMASGATIWDVHATGSHTLPASFYRTSKPSWFGNVPWPPIGPDVTGGIDAAGHAYAIPAMLCYNNTPKDSNGLLTFDANTCYGGQQTQQTLLPPTNLTGLAK